METLEKGCPICGSNLADDIVKRRKQGAIKLIKWAAIRGLQFDREQLSLHLAKHLTVNGSENGKKVSPVLEIVTPAEAPAKSDEPLYVRTVSDEQFLNQVVDIVHSGISSGDLELKVEHAFKAIELKQKLTESGGVESLLLELLNEIRKQELG